MQINSKGLILSSFISRACHESEQSILLRAVITRIIGEICSLHTNQQKQLP